MTYSASHNELDPLIRLLVGLENAVATIQRVMDVIASTLKQGYALVNQDKIFIFSMMHTNHSNSARSIICLLEDLVITNKLENCTFPINKPK